MKQASAIVFILFCLFYVHLCSAEVTRNDRVWPIGNSSSVDFPLSSAFGPRLSESLRYDFHRGVDIPATLYSNVYAIADGTVRINGSHDLYSDGVVQLRHTDWAENPDSFFYSNYIHVVTSKPNGVEPITLTDGQPIKKGDLIAYSNETASLAHIHFEIRVGGLFQRHCCNPLQYMPNSANSYSSLISTLSLTPNYNGIDCEAVVNVSVPPDQLTFTRVELHITDTNDQPQEVRFYDMCGANSNHTFAEMDDWEYQDDPSDTSSYVIRISPVKFDSMSYGKNESAGYGFEFINLPFLTGSGKVMAKVFDVFGNHNSTAYQTYTCSSGTSADNTNSNGGSGDQCVAQGLSCDANAQCSGYNGTYRCECNYGYNGNGTYCVAGCNNCSSYAYCGCDYCNGTDYGCRCDSGFTGDGTSCVDGCNGECVDYATCNGYMGNFSCQCDYGFTGDGTTNCYDIDECAMSDYCDHLGDYGYCNNTVGSYECVCEPGFFLSSYSNFCLLDDAERPFRFPPRVIEDRLGCYPDDSYAARQDVSNGVREIVQSYEERDASMP